MIDNTRYPLINPNGVRGDLQQTRVERGIRYRWLPTWAVIDEHGSWVSSEWWSPQRSARRIIRDLLRDGWKRP